MARVEKRVEIYFAFERNKEFISVSSSTECKF